MITIAITDDNEVLRQTVAERLKEDFRIVYQASSGSSMLRFLQANRSEVHPEVILMDIAMDEMDGIEATYQVKQLNPSIKVIMLTAFEDDEKVFSAIKAGADGYCLKEERKEKIVNSINDVVNGGSYMSPIIARRAMRFMQEHYTAPEPAAGNPLTQREQEILQLVIEGKTYQHIADSLFISLATVKTHVYHIYEKLQVKNKMAAARLVKEKRWI